MITRAKFILFIASLAIFPIHGYAASKIVRPIDKTIDLDGISKIEVRTQGGFIHLNGESRSDAHILVEKIYRNASEKEADEMDQDITQTIEVRGDILYIEFKYENASDFWSFFGQKPSASFNVTISTAKSVDIDLNTSGGPIEVDGIDGEVAAYTSGGHMEFNHIGGPVNARTSGGSISALEIRNEVDLSTSGGRISVDSIAGYSRLKTSGGSIKATGVNGPLEAKTSGGSITASFPRGIDADTTLKTSGGGITARLPKSEQFYLNARTSGGRVHTDFSIARKGELKRNEAEGAVNGGGPLLELKTSGGGINISYL